jgi:hypothetical protein
MSPFMSLSPPALGLIALLLTCCTPSPNPRNYTMAEPSTQALQGSYQPTSVTETLIAATGKYEKKPASIVIGADGSIEITNLPDCWVLPYEQALGQFDTGKGSWSLVRQQQGWVLLCKFPSLPNHAARGTDHGNVTAMISLVGQRPPYLLESIISHPDADLSMQFAKTGTAP